MSVDAYCRSEGTNYDPLSHDCVTCRVRNEARAEACLASTRERIATYKETQASPIVELSKVKRRAPRAGTRTDVVAEALCTGEEYTLDDLVAIVVNTFPKGSAKVALETVRACLAFGFHTGLVSFDKTTQAYWIRPRNLDMLKVTTE